MRNLHKFPITQEEMLTYLNNLFNDEKDRLYTPTGPIGNITLSILSEIISRIKRYDEIKLLTKDAIQNEYFTTDASRIMLPIDRLIELDCADENDKNTITDWINKFNERNNTLK